MNSSPPGLLANSASGVPFPAQSLAVLESEFTQEELVARPAVRRVLETVLRGRTQPPVAMSLLPADDGTDLDRFLTWMESSARATEAVFLHLDFEYSARHSADAVIGLLDAQSGSRAAIDATDPESASSPPQFEPEALFEALGESGRSVVLIIQSIDRADEDTRTWLLGNLWPLFRATIPAGAFVVTYAEQPTYTPFGDAYSLPRLSQADIAQHLAGVLGYPEQAADQEARRIHAMTSGVASAVIAGLEEDRRGKIRRL